jgi:hypothetical protein
VGNQLVAGDAGLDLCDPLGVGHGGGGSALIKRQSGRLGRYAQILPVQWWGKPGRGAGASRCLIHLVRLGRGREKTQNKPVPNVDPFVHKNTSWQRSKSGAPSSGKTKPHLGNQMSDSEGLFDV